MAEHVRHQIARSGTAARPKSVQTLAGLLDRWGAPPAAPESVPHLLIAAALERLRQPRFARVREFQGLHAEIAKLLAEVPEPSDCGGEIGEIFREVQAGLAERGFALRQERLRIVASKLRAGDVEAPGLAVFDGFFTLSQREVEFLEALSARCPVTVTLPEVTRRLLNSGFNVERMPVPRRAAGTVLFSAATPVHEAEEMARRILEQHSYGRKFRDIGVVLRSREPYGHLTETALDRFGIPFRSNFADPLISHSAIAFTAGLMRALLAGWNHAAINALLRMPASGIGATRDGDALDFALRDALPGMGLPIPGAPTELRTLCERMTAWLRETLAPLDWASRLKTLRTVVAISAPGESPQRARVEGARATLAALSAFEQSLDSIAAFGGAERVSLERFWNQVETALVVDPLRIDDRRRDVVHIMDVYEARQWELPVIFVPGLVERAFPQYHGENPLLGDTERRKLGLPTAADMQNEERFLFDLAVSRATFQTILSYPCFDEQGEETLPSFFLKGEHPERAGLRSRPRPKYEIPRSQLGPVPQEHGAHSKLSASSIEKFLQCPFQFFANKTLRLRERPKAPRDRLDVLLQGTIIHEAIAAWSQAPVLGSAILDQVFEDACLRRRVPRTYRTEAVRLELLRHFETFLRNHEVELGWRFTTEKEFEFVLNEGLTMRGRIDRLETGPHDEALVIDYKYSGQVRGRVKENERGDLVQGGLYLLAAQRAFGLRPAGMLLCGLKGGIEWQGWHVPIAGLEQVGEVCHPDRIKELMETAAQNAIGAREAILAGRVEAKPADLTKCSWCGYRDICRIETIAGEAAVEAGG